jgi:hypothetical protein
MNECAERCMGSEWSTSAIRHVRALTDLEPRGVRDALALLSRRGLEFHNELGRYATAVFDIDALALAHSRTSVVFRAFGCALRPLRAGPLVLARTRR